MSIELSYLAFKGIIKSRDIVSAKANDFINWASPYSSNTIVASSTDILKHLTRYQVDILKAKKPDFLETFKAVPDDEWKLILKMLKTTENNLSAWATVFSDLEVGFGENSKTFREKGGPPQSIMMLRLMDYVATVLISYTPWYLSCKSLIPNIVPNKGFLKMMNQKESQILSKFGKVVKDSVSSSDYRTFTNEIRPNVSRPAIAKYVAKIRKMRPGKTHKLEDQL